MKDGSAREIDQFGNTKMRWRGYVGFYRNNVLKISGPLAKNGPDVIRKSQSPMLDQISGGLVLSIDFDFLATTETRQTSRAGPPLDRQCSYAQLMSSKVFSKNLFPNAN